MEANRGGGTTDADQLLRQLQPVLRFDSHEAFFANEIRAMADNASFRLTRKEDRAASGDYVIATHATGLSADFLALRGNDYRNGVPFMDGDHFGLDLKAPDQFADKVGDYRQMERDLAPAVRNYVYGRAVGADGRSVSGLEGEVWLQYWYFYLYNDAQFGGRVDLHEGDWEMVQFLVRSGEPATAVFAQHAYAEEKNWSDVSIEDALRCPIVYPGRGSHASYFERGLHQTHAPIGDDFIPLWWDAADGRGPQIRQELVILSDESSPGWVRWKGRWGGTQPHIPFIDGASPGGPITHEQWERPAALFEKAIDHDKRPADTAPNITVRRSPPGLRVRFDFTKLTDRPDRLVLTATAGGQQPSTETIVVDSLARGGVVTRGPLDPDKSYTIDVSTISAGGVPTKPNEKPIRVGPLRAVSPTAIIAAVLGQVDRFWLWIGSLLTRRVGR